MKQNKYKLLNYLLMVVDIAVVFFSYIVASYCWKVLYRGEKGIVRDALFNNLGVVLFTIFCILFMFNMNKDFMLRGIFAEFMYVFKLVALFTGALAIIIFIGGLKGFSRGVFILTISMMMVLLWAAHCLLRLYLSKVYKNKLKNSQLFIITTSDKAEETINRVDGKMDWNSKIRGIACIDKDMEGETINGIPVVANCDNMLEYAKRDVVDEVFINLPSSVEQDIHEEVMEFENMGITVHLNIEVLEMFEGFNKSVNMFGDYTVVTFAAKFFDDSKLIIKRLIDIAGSLVGLLITFVVTIFLAPVLLIESPGPLFFKQRRVGKNGRFFYIYKFRSMYKDAEQRKKELMEKNEMSGHMFKMKDDPRITKVGKFIRKTSIDELPQFFNVLKGDMSLVGTRPPTVDEFEEYEGYHKRRLSAKPGITGMWQVSGRSDIDDFEDVVKLDLEYIDNWSLSLDFKIILKTIGVIFMGKGAK